VKTRLARARRSASSALLALALAAQGCAALAPRGPRPGDPAVISPMPEGRRRRAAAAPDSATGRSVVLAPDSIEARREPAKRPPKRKRPPRVRAESRPTPASRNGQDTARTSSEPRRERATNDSAPEVESVTSPEERRAMLARIAADTTAAGEAVRRCAAHALLPDQESVLETTRSLLAQARSALGRDELWRAESLARKARQLALSLNCPEG
jgi:hypothetical protein